MTDEVKQALDMLRRNLSANKEGIAALATIRRALKQPQESIAAAERRGRLAGLEEAAGICEAMAKKWFLSANYAEIAAEIRAAEEAKRG